MILWISAVWDAREGGSGRYNGCLPGLCAGLFMALERPSKSDLAEPAVPTSVQTPDSALRQPIKLCADIATDLWAGRELAWRMFLRNIRALYRQTFFGLFLAFLPPLANTAVWVILRSSGAVNLALDDKLPAVVSPDQFSYPLYVVTGMVIWQGFAEAFQAPIQAVQANRNLLGKFKFPRESILLVKFLEVLFNLGMRAVVLVGLFLLLGFTPFSPALLVSPLMIGLLLVLGFAIGLLLMPVAMLYNDVGKIIALALPVWMILTPIIYLPPKNWVNMPLNFLNPASPLLAVARDLLVFGESQYWSNVWPYAVLAFPLLLLGMVVYRLSIPILVERIST